MTGIMNCIPKRALPAVCDAFRDDTGYWVMLRVGWHVEGYSAKRTIHEDTLAAVKAVARRITAD